MRTAGRPPGKWGFWVVAEGIPIGRHFIDRELACAGCGMIRVSLELFQLVSILDAIRDDLGAPLYVQPPHGSGCRCPEHNQTVPGAAAVSEHVIGAAADATCPSVPYDRLYAACERRNGDGGIGRYDDGHVHIDRGPRRRWTGGSH